jgi:hypothetical protein
MIDGTAHVPPFKAKEGGNGEKPLDPVGARDELDRATAPEILDKPEKSDTEVELE